LRVSPKSWKPAFAARHLSPHHPGKGPDPALCFAAFAEELEAFAGMKKPSIERCRKPATPRNCGQDARRR
jgi:hypothetical protein